MFHSSFVGIMDSFSIRVHTAYFLAYSQLILGHHRGVQNLWPSFISEQSIFGNHRLFWTSYVLAAFMDAFVGQHFWHTLVQLAYHTYSIFQAYFMDHFLSIIDVCCLFEHHRHWHMPHFWHHRRMQNCLGVTSSCIIFLVHTVALQRFFKGSGIVLFYH